MAYFIKVRDDPEHAPPTLHINVDGTVGTGKTFLIWAITQALRELFADTLGAENIL